MTLLAPKAYCVVLFFVISAFKFQLPCASFSFSCSNDYEMLLALDENNHQLGGATVNQINNLPQSTVQVGGVEHKQIQNNDRNKFLLVVVAVHSICRFTFPDVLFVVSVLHRLMHLKKLVQSVLKLQHVEKQFGIFLACTDFTKM